MKSKIENPLTNPTRSGILYLRILEQLLADRVGQVDLVAVPLECYLDMGMPERVGHLNANSVKVCFDNQFRIAIRDFPLEMCFAGDWDEAFLLKVCEHIEVFSHATWKAFVHANSLAYRDFRHGYE